MDKSSQVSEFSTEGRFLGFVLKDGYKLKYIRVSTSEGECIIKLSKELRLSLRYALIPGDWIQIFGERKLNQKTGELKLKAYGIKLFAPNHTQTTTPVKIEPHIPEPVPTKPKAASILVCQKSDCWKRGGKAVCQALQQEISDRGLDDRVTVKQVGCMKQCKAAPNIVVNKTRYSHVHPEQVSEIIDKHFNSEPAEQKLPLYAK